MILFYHFPKAALISTYTTKVLISHCFNIVTDGSNTNADRVSQLWLRNYGLPAIKRNMAILFLVNLSPFSIAFSTNFSTNRSEFSTYIIDQSCANEITLVMHNAIADRRGKDAILVIVCAMELGIITRLPYLAAKKEFPSVGGRSNYNKYLSDGFLDSEKEPIKQLFKKRLPMLFD